MKNYFVCLLFVSLFSLPAFAQDGEMRERIEEARQEFFERELQMTADESAKFWPRYNQFQEAQDALGGKRKNSSNIALMSDAEVEQHIEQTLKMEEDKIAMRRQLISDLKQFMPVRKIALIPQTERKFKKELLKRMSERRRGQGQNRRQRQ